MVASTQRNRELIADFAPQCSALRKAQMVGIRGLTTANQTRLLGDISDVIAVSNPARLRQGQDALVDPFDRDRFFGCLGGAVRIKGCSGLPWPLRLIWQLALQSSPASP